MNIKGMDFVKTSMVITRSGKINYMVYRCKIGLVKGRNLLKNNGFNQCVNKFYYKKDAQIIHYNKAIKCWLSEVKNEF